jgi:hypothetical protein
MNIDINICTVLRKGLEECVREGTDHLASLKSKKVYKMIAFLQTLQRLKQEWQKSPALGPGKQTAKLGLVWRNRKKISQIINAYLYLPFFLLIISYYLLRERRKYIL